jgi:hypothetical protein
VYEVAAEARSIAFLKRAVAINSIVRVILRMFLIDLRRLSSALGLAMGNDNGYESVAFGMISGKRRVRQSRLLHRRL